jgi:predicted CXXCH cytochrome family protein
MQKWRTICRERSPAWLGLAAAILSAAPGAAVAGEWHLGGRLVCADCHTLHNSARGEPMRYDASSAPALALLRNETATAVCLACHGGERASAPNVLAPSNGDPPAGGYGGAGATGGHALSTQPVVPPAGTVAVVMKCTTCHDPHGNGRYRNLRPSPSGSGRAASVPLVVNQRVTANGSNPGAVYTSANVRYVSGMSAWCMDCHDALTTADTGHPWDKVIPPSSDLWTAWSQDFSLLAPPLMRVPVENPTGAIAPSAEDRVFCLSCHKAHGSPNPRGLIYGNQMDLDSTCQQCHAQ